MKILLGGIPLGCDNIGDGAYAKLTARLEVARKEFVESLEACHAG